MIEATRYVQEETIRADEQPVWIDIRESFLLQQVFRNSSIYIDIVE